MDQIGFTTEWNRPFVSTAGGSSPSGSSSSSSSSAPLSLLNYLNSLSPWALYDASSVVETGSSISQLTDLSVNARHLTDSQPEASRMTLTAGEILGSISRSFIGDFPGATVMPTDFHAFAILRTNGILVLSDCYAFSCASAINGNYAWQFRAESNGNISGFGGLGSSANGHLTPSPVIPSGQYVLAEFIYSDAPQQEWRVNGFQSGSSFGSLTHANWTWTGIRLNISPAGAFGLKQIAYKNLCIFDTSAGILTRAQRHAIWEAYAAEYPDVAIMPRYVP